MNRPQIGENRTMAICGAVGEGEMFHNNSRNSPKDGQREIVVTQKSEQIDKPQQ